MELKSEITKINIPKNQQRLYSLTGLGGTGDLYLTFGQSAEDEFYIHVKCVAGVKFLKEFHFEGLSQWEKTENGYGFLFYEEKDFAKKIHKRWEFTAEGLNYLENKKGLILEREVQYFNPPKDTNIIFDPISAATLALIEKPNGKINVFGKQRILQIEPQKDNNEITIKSQDGFNGVWSKILAQAKINVSSEGIIEKIEIPSPIQVGTIRMTLSSQKSLTPTEAKAEQDLFNRTF